MAEVNRDDVPDSVVGDTSTVGVFLEEVAYFLEDMHHDLWWLLRAAHQPSGEVFYHGNEVLEEVPPEKEEAIQRLAQKNKIHLDTHEQQVRAKIAIIPAVTSEEKDVLLALRKLKFHCRGKIEVFLCMKEANNTAIWNAYHNYVASTLSEQHWIVQTDGAGQKSEFAQCVVVVPFRVDREKQVIQLFSVWCPMQKKKHWSFPGGDIRRGIDRNLYDSARREFHEEAGVFFGRDWRDCFKVELPSDMEDQAEGAHATMFVALEKEGPRYPCRPYFFVEVSEDFYEATRSVTDESGIIRLPVPPVDYVRWDQAEIPAQAQRVHSEGVLFLEHDQARWLTLDFESGKLCVENVENLQVRREAAELFKQRPDKIWKFFADILGIAMPTRAPVLPTNFNTDGPFAVRMSRIDKTAQDDDIAKFFEAGGEITVKSVQQFDQPKHTAKIEFESMHHLELALNLTGSNLLRRKVTVELWEEVQQGMEEVAPGAKPLKEYTGPLPEAPPYICKARGLDRSVTRDDIGYFFWDRACQVEDVTFPLKAERHATIVQFQDVESLRKALSLNNALFKGREITIEIHNGVDKPPPGGGGQERNRDRPDRGFGGGGGGRGKGGKGGGRGGYNDREPPSRAEFGSERPRLNLKPRTVPLGGDGYDRTPGFDERPSGRPDPFGGARPRDDRFKATRADHDDNWRR